MSIFGLPGGVLGAEAPADAQHCNRPHKEVNVRLLTTDELFAVSGGSINGEGDPLSRNGNGDASDTCAQIEDRRKRSQCYLETARSQNCPGGWTETTEGGSAGPDGIKGRSTSVECKAGDSNDDGSDDGADDDSDG